jgi:hypothetical protein
VVYLDGTRCSLHITVGPSEFLDATGRPLSVRLDDVVPSVNPPRTARDDIPLGAGHASWGFTWTGSWCGAPAAMITLPLTGDPTEPDAAGPFGDLRVPMTGPQPSCAGRSASVLRPGVAGDPGDSAVGADALLPAPADWAGLRATLTVPSTSPAGVVSGSVFTLHNATGAPIVLSPCPEYFVLVQTARMSGAGSHPFDCRAHGTVPAHGKVAFPLPEQDAGQGDPNEHPSGGTVVTIEVAIAGVPTATATTRAG